MTSGNGDGGGQVTIDRVELAPGWSFFEAGKNPPQFDKLPHLLNRSLIDWLRANPDLVVRTTLAITTAGTTVGIHVWYDGP